MRNFKILSTLALFTVGCDQSGEQAFQRDLQATWSSLNTIYASSSSSTADFNDLYVDIITDIEKQVQREVVEGEAKLALLEADYSSNISLYNGGGGAGAMAQIADEERMRNAKKRILQFQLDGQIDKLAITRARLRMLKFQAVMGRACAETKVPNATSPQLANCSIDFQNIAESRLAFLMKVQNLRLNDPRTADLRAQVQKLAVAEQLAVRRYNKLVTDHLEMFPEAAGKYVMMPVEGSFSKSSAPSKSADLDSHSPKNDATVDRQVVATVKVIAKEGEDSYRVRYGGSAVTDGCPSNSIVVGLNPEGDNFLAVKAKPSLASARTDKLGPGAEVYHCDTSPNGKWIGIVYDGDGKWTGRCGVTSPVFRRKPYLGPCQSGWVSSKYIELVAG